MQIKKDKKGNITLELINANKKFYLHSKYDVYKEAQRFAKNFSEKSKDINILYGFGLGYHINEILNSLKDNQKLYILELRTDIFNFAKENIDIKKIMEDKRISLIVENSYEDLILKLNEINIQEDNSEFFIHEPSVNAIDSKNAKFKDILDNLKVLKSSKLDSKQKNAIRENIKLNKDLDDKEACVFFDKFKNIPGVLISAGPSLDYAIDRLDKFKNKAILFSVGRSLRAFSDLNFDPDMFMIIDPNEITKTHIYGYEQSDIPFIYLISTFANTVSSYKGPRFYFYNQEIYPNKRNALKTKSSVSTGALSMLIKMGCNPIIFIGQDLGFYKGEHHSKKVMYKGYAKNPTNGDYKYESVDNVFGDPIYINKSYKSMKLFIEKLIGENKNIEFINCSYKGAKIEGTKYMDIDDVYRKYIGDLDLDIDKKIYNIIN